MLNASVQTSNLRIGATCGSAVIGFAGSERNQAEKRNTLPSSSLPDALPMVEKTELAGVALGTSVFSVAPSKWELEPFSPLETGITTETPWQQSPVPGGLPIKFWVIESTSFPLSFAVEFS